MSQKYSRMKPKKISNLEIEKMYEEISRGSCLPSVMIIGTPHGGIMITPKKIFWEASGEPLNEAELVWFKNFLNERKKYAPKIETTERSSSEES